MCSTLSIDSSRNKGSVCELNLLLVMILRAFFCNLRQIIGVRWPNRISNVALYHRCQSRPISESIITARWRLFGHVLRLPRDAPAQRAIDHYFADTEAATFRGRPRTSLPSTLCSDLRRIGRTLRQPADIEALRALSREQWRQMERDTSA